MRDEPFAQHLGCRGTDLIKAARERDASGFAATAGMHLRLDDPQVAAEFFRGLYRFVRSGRDMALRHRNAVVRKNNLGLIFVEIHQ